MNDAEYESQKQRVIDAWAKWAGRFWMDVTWEVTFYWYREPHEPELWAFHIQPDWRYLRVALDSYLPTIQTLDDTKLDRVVCHELAHVLVNEMVVPRSERTPETHDHEERVAEQIGRALWHGFESGRESMQAVGLDDA